jgi:hypothetical protein
MQPYTPDHGDASVPTVAISEEERNAGRISEVSLDEAVQRFATSGVLILRGVLASDFVDELHAAFMDRNQRFLVDANHDDALTVGKRRFQITIELVAPFDNPLVYANPFVMPFMDRFLGTDHILGSFGAVLSLAGAPDQHVHRDFPGLFPREGLDGFLPAFAITLIVPLIDVDAITGTTLVWPGSQRMERIGVHEQTPPALPLLSKGDCMLMDYRLVHGGSANRSDRPRPLLYSAYYRPWFRDHKNYSKQNYICISRETLDGVSDEHRHLFAHVASGEIGFQKAQRSA